MSKIIDAIAQDQMKGKNIPKFSPGDTVVVQVKVKEGSRERLQAYEGVVIAKRNRGVNSSFTVRKISHGEGVERVFQTYSPLIGSITVKRRGDVRRAKLYYLRELTGRAARIKEKLASRRKGAVAETPEPEAEKPVTEEVVSTQEAPTTAEETVSKEKVKEKKDDKQESSE